jgi:hypothetical protein
VDFTETVFTESEFANIYLAETKFLAAAEAALCLLLDDARCSIASVAAQNPTTARGRAETASKRNRGTREVDDAEEDQLTEDKLLREQVVVSEEALQVLRHVIYASPYTRTTVLLCAGKSRIAELLACKYYRDTHRMSYLH